MPFSYFSSCAAFYALFNFFLTGDHSWYGINVDSTINFYQLLMNSYYAKNLRTTSFVLALIYILVREFNVIKSFQKSVLNNLHIRNSHQKYIFSRLMYVNKLFISPCLCLSKIYCYYFDTRSFPLLHFTV